MLILGLTLLMTALHSLVKIWQKIGKKHTEKLT